MLPDRQHDIDQVGIAVVQRMRAAGHAERAPLVALRAAGRSGHGDFSRRSTKVVLTSESTSSPCWLTPVERNVISPACGRLPDRRNSITSLL